MRGKNPPSPRLRGGSNERIDIFEGVARLIKFCELRGQGAHGSDQPPVRLGLLASFGGITRIRFKGSPAQFCRRTFSPLLMRPAKLELDSQPSGSPAIFHAKLRLEEPKSTRERVIGYSLLVICKKIAAATAASTP